MEVVIRRATLSDWDAIRPFITDCYGPSAPFKDVDRWLWQFAANPYHQEGDNRPSVWIALEGGRVVGQIAGQDAVVWIGGRPVAASWIVDVMVREEARGRGLAHRIHAAARRDRSLLVTLTMAPATRRVAEKAGCITLGPTHQLIRAGNVSARTVERFLRHKAEGKGHLGRAVRGIAASKIGPSALAASVRLARRLRPSHARRAQAGLQVEAVDRFGPEADALWQALRDRHGPVFERSAAFLNWRFNAVPTLEYERYMLRRQGQPAGYIVLRLADKAELPGGVIVDMFADPGDTEALDGLVSFATERLGPACEYIEAAASTPAYYRALQRAGFVAVRTMRPTVVCDVPGLAETIVALKDRWHFTKADHDWDQIHPV